MISGIEWQVIQEVTNFVQDVALIILIAEIIRLKTKP